MQVTIMSQVQNLKGKPVPSAIGPTEEPHKFGGDMKSGGVHKQLLCSLGPVQQSFHVFKHGLQAVYP